MAWGTWTRNKPAESVAAAQAAVGLDVNAGRARAAYGPAAGATPRPLALDDPHPDLPLLISLEGRALAVGRAGTGLVRRLPHLVCRDYLPALGQPREWRAGRHHLDPTQAIVLAAEQLRRPLAGQTHFAAALPAYLTVPQVTLLTGAFQAARLPLLGTACVPLALTASEGAAFGTALVVDADDHTLTCTVLADDGASARVLAVVTPANSGVRAWLDRLLDRTADRCVRLCRRDPRDSAVAEQGLYEQLAAALDRLGAGQPIPLNVRTASWYQELTLAPEEFEAFCAPLAKAAVEGMRQALAQAHAAVPAMARPDLVWVTADAARLPGLAVALAQHLPEATAVKLLPADAIARAAHRLAAGWLRGELPRGHLDGAAPRLTAAAANPARERPDRVALPKRG